ncbi:MAG: hypothetical protein IJL89_00555 [Firmicutes bacterium]|nr:hypothetical protein [Bacillota bacterium]
MARNTKRSGRNSASSNFYSDDMTKEVVGRLFEQYTAEDGKNYFAPSSRKNVRDAEEEAQKEEDRKNFFEEDDETEEIEEKKESRLSRFMKKAKMVVLPPDDDDEDEDEEEDGDAFENFLSEDGEAEPLHVPAPDSIPEIDQQQTYVPRRKERPKKAKPEVPEQEPELEEEIFAEIEQQEEVVEEKNSKRESLRERMEKRVDAKRGKGKPEPKQQPAEENSPFDDEFYDEDDDDAEVFELPFARGVLIAIVAVVLILLLVLIFRCISYSSQLKEANAQIEQLQNQNTSSTYEKELEELRSKNEELTKQLDDIRAASAVVSATDGATSEAPSQPAGSDPTVGADGQGSTNDLSQQASSDRSYTVISYSGGTPWELAEEAYGEGSRYDEILKFNNMTAEDFENITYGTELKIPN